MDEGEKARKFVDAEARGGTAQGLKQSFWIQREGKGERRTGLGEGSRIGDTHIVTILSIQVEGFVHIDMGIGYDSRIM